MNTEKPRRLSRIERNRVMRDTRKRIRSLTKPQLEELIEGLNMDLAGAEHEEEHKIQTKLDAVSGRLAPLSRFEWDDLRRHPIPGEEPAPTFLEHIIQVARGGRQ